jgi:hypothetical protein
MGYQESMLHTLAVDGEGWLFAGCDYGTVTRWETLGFKLALGFN